MINLNGEFVWWFGVVEDINDPERLGRARVRVIGYHNQDLSVLPTTQLPWATTIFPVSSASTQGKGFTVPGFLPGSHVFGFFADGVEAQSPVIMGTVPGFNAEENKPEEGFNDPYDTVASEYYKQKTDINLLAEGLPQEGTPGSKKEPVLDVETALPELTWNEHPRDLPAKYPFNKVYESATGHLIEIDDSLPPEDFVGPRERGNGRIHIYHNSGSFIELHPNGEMVIKSTGNGYTIKLGDENMLVGGSLNITAIGNCNIKAKNFTVKSDKVNFNTDDDFVVNCKKFQVNAKEEIDFVSGKVMSVGGKDEVKVLQGKNGKIIMQGGKIDLN